MNDWWLIIGRFCYNLICFEVPVFHCAVCWTICYSQCLRVKLQTCYKLASNIKICNLFVSRHIPNLQTSIFWPWGYPFGIWRHLKSIYSACVFSKSCDVWRDTCIPQLHFCIFATSYKLVITFCTWKCSTSSHMSLKFYFFVCILQVPDMYGSTISSREQSFWIISKFKCSSKCFLSR